MMPPALLAGLLLALAGGASTAAEPIYRCGQSFSQTPCPGATLVEPDDAPSAARRAEAQRVAEREKALGDRLERERLQQLAAQPPALATGFDARPPAGKSAPQSAPKSKKKSKTKSKSGSGGDFVAIAPPASTGSGKK